ncbi:HET-domain-containing protein, partial [Bimuria novae-zelandiae CBS 107.79]
VEECALHHPDCGRGYARPHYSPTRLIQICAGGNHWRLRDNSQLMEEARHLRYIALSYTWGQHQQLLLRKGDLADLKKGMNVSDSLPKTFRDLIHVARRLSVDLIWIDALCIIQDSHEDWAAESMRMRAVYANAYCTIAASWGTDPTKGLSVDRDYEHIRPASVQTSSQVTGRSDSAQVRIIEHNGWKKILERSALHKRGWALQERLLSPRILYFTKEQILFECDIHRVCELFPTNPPPGYAPNSSDRRDDRPYTWYKAFVSKEEQTGQFGENSKINSFFRRWLVIVEDYTKCHLTKRSDKLIALNGLVDLFEHLSGEKHLTGLWRSHIWESLLWRVSQNHLGKTEMFPSFP